MLLYTPGLRCRLLRLGHRTGQFLAADPDGDDRDEQTMCVCRARPSGIAPRLTTRALAKAARPSGVQPEFWM